MDIHTHKNAHAQQYTNGYIDGNAIPDDYRDGWSDGHTQYDPDRQRYTAAFCDGNLYPIDYTDRAHTNLYQHAIAVPV